MTYLKNKVKEPWENQACPMCRANKIARRCDGHGGGVSGSGDEGKSASSGSELGLKALGNALLQKPELTRRAQIDEEYLLILAPSNTFNPEVILALLSEGKLIIDSNAAKHTLTIHLNNDPDSLSPEQKIEFNYFLNAIIDELHAFEKEHMLSSKFEFNADKNGNIISFSITLADTKTYELFMRQLLSKSLFSSQDKISQKFTDNLSPQPNVENISEGKKSNGQRNSPFQTSPRPWK